MTTFNPNLVLIDLDGTLVDSVPDLAFAVDHMMMALEMPQHGETKVRQWVGNGIEKLVKRALTDDMDEEPEAELFEQGLQIFKGSYAECNGRHSQLYDGVQDGLGWLKQEGFTVACITNKAQQFTTPLLDKLGILGEFELVVSGDSLPKKKPDPMPLLHSAAHFSITPSKALMIGDSMTDVKAARNAEFGAVICVTYGYNHGIDIREANPDSVIDSFAQLPQLLQSPA
ncbi:phosphoglycolate phosphatase [Candidatus Albibeggiatoa sp. nov. NOAA]|uniref:phosphoglycolate phosphatase n=1 Tax=Candidatus Albibeggiatoa sp. nov. NOAA TaxID=3162724 RepID=UPI0032F5B54E|nr:phosphoglycolate phosphatase [Thiotrichaceae bacterium]